MKTWRPWYIIIANTAILICVLQVASYGVLRAYYFAVNYLPDNRSEAVKRNYAHMTAEEYTDFMKGDRQLRFRIEPRLGIIQAPLTSRFINIDDYGIRANGPTPHPIAKLDGAIWFLGGSTTFGDGIADHETIPAQVERLTGRMVFNMGVPGFASPMENALFAHHLRTGNRPSLAVFFDGINETCEPELYDEETRELFRRAQQPYYWEVSGPLGTLVTRAFNKAMRAAQIDPFGPEQADACEHDGRKFKLVDLHRRIMGERQALCDAYHLDCRTVVQPFSGTHGPTADLSEYFRENNAKQMREVFFHLEPSWQEAGAIFVTDALDHYPRHPFIDDEHYSADASRVIAEVIVSRLNLAPR